MRLTTNKTGVVSWRMTESSDLRNVGSLWSVAAFRLLTWLGENSRNTSLVSQVSGLFPGPSLISSAIICQLLCHPEVAAGPQTV